MRTQVQFDRRRNAGVLGGVLGCAFAVMGIFTLGFLFIPIAALCTIIGLLSGIAGSNLSGIAVSALGAVLSLVGLATSPVLLLLLGISLTGHSAESRTNDSIRTVATATIDEQPRGSAQSQDDLPCPVGGTTTVLRGTASRQSANGRFVLKTEKPFCLTLNPPLAPRQRAVISIVEIDGQPPPVGVLMELTGKLYPSPLTPDGGETPILKVASGRRIVRTE
jgi:hypothetical protein